MRQHKAKERVLQDVVLYYVYFRMHAHAGERERERLIHSSGLKPGRAETIYIDSSSS